jgi:hypothetical protein
MVTDRALRTFFEDFGKAVTAGDVAKLGDAFATPALVLSDERRRGLHLHRVARRERTAARSCRASVVSSAGSGHGGVTAVIRTEPTGGRREGIDG